MIKIYVSPSCSSCRKVKAWFKEHKIPFAEINIFDGSLTANDIKDMLTKSLDGTSEIISTRSKIVKEKNINLEDISLNTLVEFIRENPTVLRRPIIVDDGKIQTGYNVEEIRTFVPQLERIMTATCSVDNCPKYVTCPHQIDKH